MKKYTYLVNGNGIFVDNLTVDDLIILYKQYFKLNGSYPTTSDCKYENNLPSTDRIGIILENNKIDKFIFYNILGMKYRFPDDNKYYQQFLDIFIDESKKKGSPITCKELTNNTFGIPDGRWFINHCPDKNIKNYNQFIEWCGLKPRYEMSKEKVIEIILDMQSKIDRPLMKVDFRKPTQNSVGMGVIKRYWGGINDMKRELGLTIVGQNLKLLTRPLEQLKEDIVKLCDKIEKEEHRKTITKDDIDNCNFTMSFSTYNKTFKEKLNMSIRDYLESIGFELLKSGSGLVYYHDSGEITSSQFEYSFTNYLNKYVNLKYNVDYKRDIRYKTFIKDYKGLLNCDYVIEYKNRIIYIEIAGLLRDYKEWYLNDKPIQCSKSKEKYRLKLKKKEDMLKSQRLEYYILFPCDLNDEIINKIFN